MIQGAVLVQADIISKIVNYASRQRPATVSLILMLAPVLLVTRLLIMASSLIPLLDSLTVLLKMFRIAQCLNQYTLSNALPVILASILILMAFARPLQLLTTARFMTLRRLVRNA